MVSCVALVSGPQLLQADTIHLRNGNTIEGEIIREDDVQIIVRIEGGEAVFSPSEIASIHRSPRAVSVHATTEQTKPKDAFRAPLLERMRQRVGIFQQYLERTKLVMSRLKQRHDEAAKHEAEEALQSLLPFQYGVSMLVADLLLWFLSRGPGLYLALTIVHGLPKASRVAFFLLIEYGIILSYIELLVVAMAQATGITLLIEVTGSILCVAAELFLLMRLFGLNRRKISMVLLLTSCFNIGMTYLLVRTQIL